MFIGSADPDLGGSDLMTFLIGATVWPCSLKELLVWGTGGAEGVPAVPKGFRRRRRGSGGSENMFIGSADPDLGGSELTTFLIGATVLELFPND